MLKIIEENKEVMLLQVITSKEEYFFLFQPIDNYCVNDFEQKDQAVNIRQKHWTYTGYLSIGYYNDLDNIDNFHIYQQQCQKFYDLILKNNLDILKIKVYFLNLNNDEDANIISTYNSEDFSLDISLNEQYLLNKILFDSDGRLISPSIFYSHLDKRILFTGFIFYLDGVPENYGVESSDRRMRWIL